MKLFIIKFCVFLPWLLIKFFIYSGVLPKDHPYLKYCPSLEELAKKGSYLIFFFGGIMYTIIFYTSILLIFVVKNF